VVEKLMEILAVLFVVCAVMGWWCFVAFTGLTGVKFVGRALQSRSRSSKRYFDFGGHGTDYTRRW
jgi:hypothetical protein